MTNNSVNVGAFGKLTVQDDQGKQHQLSEFWQTKHAAFLFIRHFG